MEEISPISQKSQNKEAPKEEEEEDQKPKFKSSIILNIKKDKPTLAQEDKIKNTDAPELKLRKIFRTLTKKTIPYQTLLVSEKNSPFKTISSAIKAAKGPTIILVDSGLYNERLRIKKPDLKIMPSNNSQISDIILLNSYSSSIEISIPNGGKCEIINFKITHTAKNDEAEEKQKEKQKLVNAFVGMKSEFLNYDNNDARGWKSNTLAFDDGVPALVRVSEGNLIMKDCMLSLNFLQKSTDFVIPSVIIEKGSQGVFHNCTIRGNLLNPSLGFYVKDSNCIIEECRINNNSEGGVIYNGREKNIMMINKTNFYANKHFHVEITGLGNKTFMEKNFMQGDGTSSGIRIGIGTMPKIFNNDIRDMAIGIEIVSSDAFIIKNKITGCDEGVFSKTFDGLINQSKIKLNEISDNQRNGVRVSGENNKSVVIQNVSICRNKKAGVRIEEKARAKVKGNTINNNIDQGILIVENSSGFIESNAIFHNIKANIALGGKSSENTVIIGNRIFESSSEGIFVMLGGPCVIYNNYIYKNYDGIVVLEAVPEISFNTIYENRNNGVQLLRGSLPTMRCNNIYGNEGIGIVFREKSLGIIQMNEICDNELEFAVEYDVPKMRKLAKENYVRGEFRLPYKPRCSLI